MPVRTPLLALALLAVTACSATPSEAPSPPATVDPPAAEIDDPDRPAPAVDRPFEVSLTIPVGTAPDGTELEIVVRSVQVGERREVTMQSPDGLVDHHVIDGDDHWWWIPPVAHELTGGVEWIHLDVGEVAEVGELPDLVADARLPVPRPGALAVGQVVAGEEVLAVDRLGPNEELLHLAGLPEPAVVRVRSLPETTRIQLPQGATELRDLPEAVDWTRR